jgi:hypothetical protein
MQRTSEGFTLIELIAVIVVLDSLPPLRILQIHQPPIKRWMLLYSVLRRAYDPAAESISAPSR